MSDQKPIDFETAEFESEEELDRAIAQQTGQGGAVRRDWKLLPKALPYLRPYRKLAAVSIVLTVFLALLALAEPWPLAFVIDSVLGDEPIPGWASAIFGDGTGGLIALGVVAMLLITLLGGAFMVINEYLTTKINGYMGLEFRSDLFQQIQRLALGYHDKVRMGILMFRFNTQSAAVGQIVVGLPAILQSILTVLGMAVITISIDPLLGLLALGVTPFIFYSTTFYADRIEPRLYKVRGLEGMNMAIAHEAMSMLRVVLAFGRERSEWQRWRNQGEEAVAARVDLTVRQTAFQLVVQLITALGTAGVLGLGAYLAIEGRISAGELVVVLTYIAAVYAPLEQLTQTVAGYQQYFIAFRHAYDLLQEDPDVVEKPDAKAIDRVQGALELEDVHFGYGERGEALKGISFKVDPGQAVAVVGPTGAGKSTLASLLPRFYEPQQGRVLIDGEDVSDLTLDSLREQFSIVLQEPLLFSTNIKDNIKYGRPDATDKQVREAARAANVHDFIMGLPDGYRTKMGERGARLSGGERQRIAVARAFLRDSPILILDEPTSSIDSRTEAVILEALDKLMEGRTTILIAHRLSTLRSVAKILVLNEGELVEEGTHEQLIANNGLYTELWRAQVGDELAVGSQPQPPAVADAGPGEAVPLVRPTESTPAVIEPAPSKPAAAPAAAPAPAGGAGSASLPRPKVVLLGMLTKIPVGGVAWLVGQYATGFERLGYEVYYVEAHARTPSMFMTHERDDAAGKAATYIAGVADRFGLGDRWAFQALHENGRCYGMSEEQLDQLYRDAALIVNMHGGTLPLPEHAATERLVFLGTDPVEVELEVERGDQRAVEFLDQHTAFFTWGLNFGNPDCELPWASPYGFIPSPPPVVLDFWDNDVVPDAAPFTTIGNWRQKYRNVRHQGRVYRWSKHQQFMKVLDLPRRAGVPLELALSSYDDDDHLLLAEHGWRVRPGYELSRDLDSYREYIVGSAGEFSVAKEQNVVFRSGWFSERSATYLAAGRPVIMQDTGFGNTLPTGEGLFAFEDAEGAAEALARVTADPARHRKAARELAREYLSHEVVLGDLLEHVGLRRSKRAPMPARNPAPAAFAPDLSLEVQSRKPLKLPEETVEEVRKRPVPSVRRARGRPLVNVVVPVLDNLVPTRMALEGVLANTDEPPYSMIVVDNGSADPTREYLEALASRNAHIRLLRNDQNRGFAAACNQGVKAARAEHVVLLNNDTIVPPGWLAPLLRQLEDEKIGIVGPTTNRCGGSAQIQTRYATYGEMIDFATRRHQGLSGREAVDIDVAEMFCVAFRKALFEEIGPLDERFEIGMFEDDDYMRRVRDAGYRVVCAEDAFVHHFGEASLGELAADGAYGELFHANRRRFEEKWGIAWEPHGRRTDPEFEALVQRVSATVKSHVPDGAKVLVVSRGADELIRFGDREGWHFPQLEDGTYAGQHPADDAEAIAELERLRERGAEYLVLPATALWWLDHYQGFRDHLDRFACTVDEEDVGMIFDLADPAVAAAGEAPA
jgi:ABC-type multidrug transport system fused ATPase/permease subunit/GT2 family glycosyltransferase